ncbi:MAG: sulfotransferase family protein [Myxococcales bacterium]|nr:sulfotransferase family protein [Myxococcales bacterium]
MTLRVIGAGFGRTGTMSLKVALERLLGGRCYHMKEVFESPGHPDLWARKARGEDIDFDALFRGYVATVDWPSTRYYAELAERYPEALVVLTQRDPGRWYESTRETIFDISKAMRSPPMTWLAAARAQSRPMPGMVEDTVWGTRGHFGGRFEDRDHAIAVYEAHIEEVEATIPADRLLVYELSQGWEPLCTRLGVPVPSEPMPHVNDRAEMLRRLRVMKTVGWLAAPLTYTLGRVRGMLGAG